MLRAALPLTALMINSRRTDLNTVISQSCGTPLNFPSPPGPCGLPVLAVPHNKSGAVQLSWQYPGYPKAKPGEHGVCQYGQPIKDTIVYKLFRIPKIMIEMWTWTKLTNRKT